MFWRGQRSFAEELQAIGSNPCFRRLIEEIRDTAIQLEHEERITTEVRNGVPYGQSNHRGRFGLLMVIQNQ